jgi:fibronectin type 3 domain-containing protein
MLIGTTDKNEYHHTGLRAGNKYFYKIEAVSSDGEDISAMSETINIKCESIPAAPTGLEVGAAVEPYSVDLTWNAVEDATGYEIYRYMGAESGYEPIGRTDKTEYKVTGLKNGAKHNFRVAAIKEEADYTHISNLSDSAGAIPKRMAAPTGLTASVTEAYEITLNWDKNEYADRYDINIYDSDKKVYVYAGSTEKTSYTIGELAPNVNYVFRIEGVAVFENEEFKSALSDLASCKTMGGPDPVAEVEYISKDNDSMLRWSASKTATRYRVYASAALPDEEDELIGETDKTELSLNTLTPNTMYRLYIVAVKVQDNLTLSGKPSDIFTIFMPPVSRYILGDADGSGDVDIVDATIIQRYSTLVKVAVDEETLMHGDINGDGYLDIVDAAFIQRYSTFIKVPYPIGTFV